MYGSVALFRSCSVSWSKLLLIGNLLCLCFIGGYWLTGRPVEEGLDKAPDGTVPLVGQVSELGYSTKREANGNATGSGDVLVTPSDIGEKVPSDGSVSSVESTNSASGSLLYSVHSLKDRRKFQRVAMQQFCNLHPVVRSDLPTEEKGEDEVFKHLLYDDTKEIIFCYVPKVGCSNWKRMFVVLNGLLPPTESSARPSEDILRGAYKLVSLSAGEREWRLKKYFKVTMLRNPLERIVSAYRNKVAVPIDYEHSWSFPSRDLVKMLRQFEPDKYELWRDKEGKVDVHPSFHSFLRYLIATPRNTLNEHFRPVVDLCRPCEFQYDLYTNFKFLPDDALRVLDLFDIPHHYYLNREAHPHLHTAQLVHSYFENITLLSNTSNNSCDGCDSGSGLSTLQTLFSDWSDELDLYYSLFPEEKDSHMQYLARREEQTEHHQALTQQTHVSHY